MIGGGVARSRPPGRMVTAAGRRLHVLSHVSDGPTVVLESGLGEPLSLWHWVIERVVAEGRCSLVAYERPGVGFSGSARPPRPDRYPAVLKAVLDRVGTAPPYVLVGHSVGGLLIRMFADRYPDLVGGMVFVDSTHPDQYQRSAAQRRGLEPFDRALRHLVRRARLNRPLLPAAVSMFEGLPADLVEQTADMAMRLSTLRTARAELALTRTDWAAGARRLSEVDCPVAVLSASSTVSRDPTVVEMHLDLAELSRTHRVGVVAGAGHVGLLAERHYAERVVDAIGWVRSAGDTVRPSPPASSSSSKD